MEFNSDAIRQFIVHAARLLHVPRWQLSEDGQGAIREVLRYFETGELASRERVAPFPRIVRPRLVLVGDHLLAVRTVMITPHAVHSTVLDAFVTFSTEQEAIDVPPWRQLRADETSPSHGDVAYTFTSAQPARTNLQEFAETILSNPASVQPSDGTSALVEWMAMHPVGGD